MTDDTPPDPQPLTAEEEIVFAAIPEHIWQGDPNTRNQRRRDLAKRIVEALDTRPSGDEAQEENARWYHMGRQRGLSERPSGDEAPTGYLPGMAFGTGGNDLSRSSGDEALRAALDDPEVFGWHGPPTYAIAYAAAIRDVKAWLDAPVSPSPDVVDEERNARILSDILARREALTIESDGDDRHVLSNGVVIFGTREQAETCAAALAAEEPHA